MAFKVILLFAVVTITSAGIIAQYQHEEPANYQFNYEVHEAHTGDIKRQHEEAKDGGVSGEYSLVEPDGIHRRVVTYTANDHDGFNAKVHREAWNGGHQQQVTKVIAPIKVIQPAVHTYSAPAHYYPAHQSSHNSHNYYNH